MEQKPDETSPSPGVGAIDEVVHDSLQYASASAATLASEPMPYWDGLLRDVGEGVSRLAACRSPLDILALQQSFAVSRFEAWLGLGTRWLERCVVDQAEPRPGLGGLTLPE